MHNDLRKRAFWVIFCTQLFQSFSILGLRSVLILYLINALHLDDATAYMIFGSYVSLLCIAPVIGGYLTDHYLGTIKSIVLGGLISVCGFITMALMPTEHFFLGLSAIVIGTSLMLPTLCNAIGEIYRNDHLQHDQAYNYFYIAVNVGGIMAALCVGYLATNVGWNMAFNTVALGIIISLCIFSLSIKKVRPYLNNHNPPKKHLIIITALLIASIFIVDFFLQHIQYIKWLLITVGGFALFQIIKIFFESNNQQRKNLSFLSVIFIIMVFYFIMYEQSGTSILLFTERVLDRHLLMHTIPTPMLTALNPFYVITLTPILGVLWTYLARRKNEPGILSKIALGIILTSLGFLILTAASLHPHPAIWWLVGASLFLTLGELLFGPVSLSAISNFAPDNHKTTLLGVWFIMGAIASYLSALLAKHSTTHINPTQLNSNYINIFSHLSLYGLIVGISILLICTIVNRYKFR